MSYSNLDTVLANAILDLLFSAAAYSSPGTWYLGALKAGGTEVSAAGYARLAVTNNATNFPAASSRQKLMHVAQAFAAANTGVDWSTVEAIGLYTVSSAGTRQAIIYLGGAPLNFTAPAATDTLTSAAHGFIADQRVRVDTLAGLSLPAGISAGTDYFVRNPATNTFQLATAAGGSAIDLTVDGAGIVFAWRSKGVSDGDILNFNADDLVVTL